MYELTANQYYGGLNRRFEKRARRLRSLGFVYESTAYGGIFTRTRRNKLKAIPAAVLHHADNRAWFDTLRWSL